MAYKIAFLLLYRKIINYAAKQQTIVYADGGKAATHYDINAAEQFVIKRIGGWKPLRRRRKARLAVKLLLSSGFCQDAAANAVFCDSWKSMEFMPPFESPSMPPLQTAVFAHNNFIFGIW